MDTQEIASTLDQVMVNIPALALLRALLKALFAIPISVSFDGFSLCRNCG